MKLLLIEDDRKIAASIGRGLEAEGFVVELATDGIDGLWKAQEFSYDLIVLDLMLPGRNGYQVCAALREAGNWTPVLVLTAKVGDLDEAEALDTGADDFLSKPFSFAVLVARIRALLRRAPGPVYDSIEVGELKVEPAARRVLCRGQDVVLTAREFDVLHYLARHAGQALSKREILGGVWHDDFDGDPNIVEVYVRRLRRKLEGPLGQPFMSTIRGVGYRLDLPESKR